MAGNVVVVGSLSVDFVMRVPRRPAKGETITGFDFNTFVGGKGNNQALAAARAGAKVHMVGCVGEDSYGDKLIQTLTQDNVDTMFLFRSAEHGTGIANIYVDPEGDNSIVIVPRSNALLSKEHVERAKDVISTADVLMLQLEINLETVEAAAEIAHAAGVKVMLNPAPAPPEGKLPESLLKNVDLFIPNQTEAELMTGVPVTDPESAIQAAHILKDMGVREVIVTLGDQGALVVEKDGSIYCVHAFPVTAIDTTAAGDAFCGAVAAALANKNSLGDAVFNGCAAGALATTVAGAEPSLPVLEQIEKLAWTALKR